MSQEPKKPDEADLAMSIAALLIHLMGIILVWSFDWRLGLGTLLIISGLHRSLNKIRKKLGITYYD